MQVGVTYSEPGQQFWLMIEVPETASVREAIECSGVLRQFPHIDLQAHKLGVFGRLVLADAPVRAGDRIEIYRAITCDPQAVARRDSEDD